MICAGYQKPTTDSTDDSEIKNTEKPVKNSILTKEGISV